LTVEDTASHGVSLQHLITLRNAGFKVIPLDENDRPCEPWTPIYEDPTYWTVEKLNEQVSKFRNVATCFGMTRKDDQGSDLFLNCLDIDSDNVYKILFNLENDRTGQEFSFIAAAMKSTFVTKTRKPNGFHIYWLSHEQNKAISTVDCKPGFEFEIKTDKRGHCTLPPSTHRDDNNFHYKNFGQDIIIVSDKMYDELMMVLSECLKTQSEDSQKYHSDLSSKSAFPIELSNEEIQSICDSISLYYKKGFRHPIVYGLCGLFRKYDVPHESAINVIQTLAKDDEERKSRLGTLEDTYKKDPKAVSGGKYLLKALEHATGDCNIAKEILEKIFRIMGKGINVVLWLTQAIIKEYTFKTMKDNDEIYYYDSDKELFVTHGEWLIKEYCETLRPEITTHQVQEIINHVKRKTGADRSSFDCDPVVLNLQNGLLDIHTGEFREHSSNHLSLVQLPIKYDPNAKCPNILRFLGQVLKPNYIFTALELFGYCLYKTAKYEKAVMCVGKGDNGKSTFLKVFEHFLGLENVSHASLQELNSDKFAIADLHGKSANIYSDLKAEKLTNTGVFKMLVSGDSIRAQKKHGQPFDYRNYAKLIYSANQIPQSDDITYAYFKRWIILIFDRIFIKDDKDSNLIDYLATESELSGLLNLALIALRQLIKDNGFIHTDDIETVEREYNLNANTVERFLADKCTINISDRESFGICRDIYHAYVLYCKDNKITPLPDNSFGMELAQKHIKKDRKMVNRVREYCYIGINLLTAK
jgi:P4 family phage/plasmid primase-like protien